MEHRVICAMLTPFVTKTAQNPVLPAEVDYGAAMKLASRLYSQGVEALVVGATTGSSARLTVQERIQLADQVAPVVGRNRVIVGAGSSDTAETIDLVDQACRWGFTQFLVVTPYYGKTSQIGLYAHYAALLARHRDSEFILYCVQARTGQRTDPRTIAQLAEDFPNLVGVKDADGSAHAQQVWQATRLVRDDFKIWSGNDGDTIKMPFAHGVIGVDLHLFAPERANMLSMMQVCQQSDPGGTKWAVEQARATAVGIDRALQPLGEALMDPEEPNPIGVRYLVDKFIMPVGIDRLPVVSPSEAFANRLDARYQEALQVLRRETVGAG